MSDKPTIRDIVTNPAKFQKDIASENKTRYITDNDRRILSRLKRVEQRLISALGELKHIADDIKSNAEADM